MKINNYLNYKLDKKLLLYLIIFVGAFLKVLYFYQFDDYYDDWNFFFTVDPNVSNEITWVRYFGFRNEQLEYNLSDWSKVGEDFPYYFAFLTKYIFNYINYSVENVHIFLLIFSIGSLFILIKVCNLISKDLNFKILVLILFVTNLFLIRELNALRPHALSVFLSLLILYYFILIYLKNKTSLRNIIVFSTLSLFFVSIWPLNLAFFFGLCCFLFKVFLDNKIKDFKILIIPPLLIIILYLIFNFNYLEYQVLNKSTHYTSLNIKFFYSYFFHLFFGSIFLGALMLFLFVYFLAKDIMQIFKKGKKKFIFFIKNLENESIFLTIILNIYTLIVIYSLIKAPVMAPKYIPYIVPIIIIWISFKIYKTKNKLLYYFVMFASILNLFLFWDNIQIERPPTKKILKIISNSNLKKVYTHEDAVFNHYLGHYNVSLYKKINFLVYDNDKIHLLPKEFWSLCLNNPRFSKGKNNYPDEDKCFTFHKNKNFKIIESIRYPDYLLHHIKKIN